MFWFRHVLLHFYCVRKNDARFRIDDIHRRDELNFARTCTIKAAAKQRQRSHKRRLVVAFDRVEGLQERKYFMKKKTTTTKNPHMNSRQIFFPFCKQLNGRIQIEHGVRNC